MTEPILPMRTSSRALLFDEDGRVLLAEHRIGEGSVWVGPGGGVEAGETLTEGLARELREETGLVLADLNAPTLVWRQKLDVTEMEPFGYSGVHNHYFVVPLAALARGAEATVVNHAHEEGVIAMRWWSLAEIETAHQQGTLFSPRDLPKLLHRLLDHGSVEALAAEPLALGL